MHFILSLFRSRQQDGRLLGQPFLLNRNSRYPAVNCPTPRFEYWFAYSSGPCACGYRTAEKAPKK